MSFRAHTGSTTLARMDIARGGADTFYRGGLARDIATKIESTMQYPGTIKVNVIRETRAIDYAK